VYLSPEHRLTFEEEKRHYALHRNDPSDARYRDFLGRLAEPLAARLPAGVQGLDFGSGPGPTLPVMLEERGFHMSVYDPLFAPDADALCRTYDFITCTETAEHFVSPGLQFERLDRLLRPRGLLGVMTAMLSDAQPFETWHYVRDPTHVSFYRPRTMRWIALRHGWSAVFPRMDVVLFGKPGFAPRARDARGAT
jgi:hypothetical protein